MYVHPDAYQEKLDDIKRLVNERFRVSDISYVGGVLTFKIDDDYIKERFKDLYKALVKIGYAPTAERAETGILLKIHPYRGLARGSPKIPIILLIATFVTVLADGYIRSISIPQGLPGISTSLSDVIRNSLLFTTSIMAIIGIHELGHKISAKIDGIDSSLPYFIPGLPGQIPTFGAVIFQRSPVVNRDDLFDLGISGPIAGFVVSILILYLAFENAIWVSQEEAERIVEHLIREEGTFLPRPLIFDLMAMLVTRPGYVPFIPPTPFGLAAWLGMLVTSLNMLPIWQLDGGRIFRSIASRRLHRAFSYAAVVVLLITGYLLLAVLLLLLMRHSVDIAPLDSVSPLSPGRKLALIGGVAMVVVTYIIFPNPFIPL